MYLFYDVLSFYRYSVMAGTPEKMLEHLLGTCIGTPCDTSGITRSFIRLSCTENLYIKIEY